MSFSGLRALGIAEGLIMLHKRVHVDNFYIYIYTHLEALLT